MKRILLLFYFVCGTYLVSAQIKYNLRVESGLLIFQNTTIDVDPGPNWKGYSLNEDQNGFAFDVINGVSIINKLLIGLGLGYLNFEGINGYSIYGDVQYIPLKTRLSPLLNLKLGSNHIWNQYENGQQSTMFELGGGINYKLKDSFKVYISSGLLLTQQSFLIPINIGIRLK